MWDDALCILEGNTLHFLSEQQWAFLFLSPLLCPTSLFFKKLNRSLLQSACLTLFNREAEKPTLSHHATTLTALWEDRWPSVHHWGLLLCPRTSVIRMEISRVSLNVTIGWSGIMVEVQDIVQSTSLPGFDILWQLLGSFFSRVGLCP